MYERTCTVVTGADEYSSSVQECDATGDAIQYKSRAHNI